MTGDQVEEGSLHPLVYSPGTQLQQHAAEGKKSSNSVFWENSSLTGSRKQKEPVFLAAVVWSRVSASLNWELGVGNWGGVGEEGVVLGVKTTSSYSSS